MNNQTDATFLFYATGTQKFKALEANDLSVSLLVDEFHLFAYLDHKGRTAVGSAYDFKLYSKP